ncbi:ORC1-type DNA replication protein [Candidatus Bathyarchaeota archaeon]|nr:ORC1-type DNA replication protein [Candidatus Bathyarchaeota archaeon]NIU80990.1 ORC1-type DNA replication protein [Candidatus Bathyarchaeota archaeon]NIV67635.1 ORC1-type DNA replication protein [Candidatus Bathyarchaeota archaeon]NIW16170.1 ORC1-type DNA replication protein [Candidatus Bathyarchaeota archaeon]NIW34256.1 ORC1-type DNA replication protein [Candidatus Bathyarchaeota archaeon]
MRYYSVFRDETKLDINYVPQKLPHREEELDLLKHYLRYTTTAPGKMSQRILITGKVGTGKTATAQHFGKSITRKAQNRDITLKYIHVNCRQCRGSLFLILQQAIQGFIPTFPRRGYSAEELLQSLMQILDERDAYLILTLDELAALISRAGSDPLYNLTRVQENRLEGSNRLTLICILRQQEYLEKLDPSTRSTLQQNVIRLEEYTRPQLRDILMARAVLAFTEGAVITQSIDQVAQLAAGRGDARYAIELLWRAGKYADSKGLSEVTPECVRKAAVSVYPTVRKDVIRSLGLHKRLFLLSIARHFRETASAHVSMGEAEDAYAVVCEEYDEERRGHTQLWKYVKELSALGIIERKPSSSGRRGKTTLIGLPRIPASDLEVMLERELGGGGVE